MGLGLSMCRTVVEQHGGDFGLPRQCPRGTVFTFTPAGGWNLRKLKLRSWNL